MTAPQPSDASSVDHLIDEYAARVYSLALAVTGTDELAAEVTEDVFRQIRTSPIDLTGPSTTRSGVMRLAHSCAVQRLRAARAQATGDHTTSPVNPLDRHSAARSPMLEQLTGDEAAALNLTYFQGRTLAQAAGILGQSVPVLVKRLTSAFATLGPQPTDRPYLPPIGQRRSSAV
ncbi:MAG: hypothetical protein WCB04_04500 [Mycobacteriales bacterium]